MKVSLHTSPALELMVSPLEVSALPLSVVINPIPSESTRHDTMSMFLFNLVFVMFFSGFVSDSLANYTISILNAMFYRTQMN